MQMSLRQMLLRSGFVRREDGVVAIEAMVMMPLMFLTFMALFVTFDAYRQYAVHQKAAYVVSDMISRETMPINSAYIDGTHQICDTLTQREQNSSIRVTVVRFDAAANEMVLEWSETPGGLSDRDDASVNDWTTLLPRMVNGEEMIVVETWARYTPPFRAGIGSQEITNFIFTRPRYAPQIDFDDGAGGLNS